MRKERAAVRSEPRDEALRIVEYTRFPRVTPDPRPRVGFTRDLSPSGMRLSADEAEEVGTLLRVTVRGLDGEPASTCVERVVWCSAEPDGRYWLGLERLSEARLHRDPAASELGPLRGAANP